jgi:hypothetical protein
MGIRGKRKRKKEENYAQLPEIDIFLAKIPSNHQLGENIPTFLLFLHPFFFFNFYLLLVL